MNAESAEFEIVSSAGKIWSFGVSSSEVICPYIFVGVALFIAFVMQEAEQWMKAIELRIKETLSGSISHKRMVSHCACNDISVLVFLVSMFLSLPSQNSSNELEKQGICSVEGNDVCADCSAPSKHGKHPTFPSTCLVYILLHFYTHLSSSFITIHTSHPPSLLYTPLILLHCYTYLSSSFIAIHTSHPPSLLYTPLILLHCYTHLSSSFIAIHTSHPPSLLYTPLILLHCYTHLSSSFIAIHTSHPPSLLYTPLILLHCYTHLSSSFIATHLSSSFIAIHTSHPPSLLHIPLILLHCYTPLILLHCYAHLSSSFIATHLSSSFIAIHTSHPPSLLCTPLILLHCYTHLSSSFIATHLSSFIAIHTSHHLSLLYTPFIISAPSSLLPFLSCLCLFSSSPSPLLQHNNTLFHTCLYRTGMGLPEPGLSPVHRMFWGPQDARVTHLSRSISCIGRVDTRADSCDGIHWQQGVQEHMGSEEDQVETCST